MSSKENFGTTSQRAGSKISETIMLSPVRSSAQRRLSADDHSELTTESGASKSALNYSECNTNRSSFSGDLGRE
jgi:hypothetical protein